VSQDDDCPRVEEYLGRKSDGTLGDPDLERAEAALEALRQRLEGPGNYGHLPASLQHVLDTLEDDVKAIIDGLPDCTAPTARTRHQASARKLASSFWETAALSPIHSEIRLALYHVASRLLKRADRCRHPTPRTRLRGVAHGYLAVMGEFAVALAVAQDRQASSEELPSASALLKPLEKELLGVLSTVPLTRAEPRLWPREFDTVIHAVATHALQGNDSRIRKLQKQFERVRQRVSHDVETLFMNDVEVAQLRSWLEALTIVFESYGEATRSPEPVLASAAP